MALVVHRHLPGYSFTVLLLLATSVLLPALPQSPMPVAKLPIADLQKMAATGDPAAQNELGVRYRLGTDVEKDPAKAVPWFLKAARQGNAKAYFNLGAAYYNGDGVGVNDTDSCVWFILAADAGDPRGQEAVARARSEMPPRRMTECEVLTGSAYISGNLIPEDYAKAMQWYLKASNDGSGIACEKIAYLYDRGLGVPVDKEQSLKWLQRSANLGYPPAIYELGRAYETGEAVPQDSEQATKLYDEAASQGQLDAFLALGNMYKQGLGVKTDHQKSLMYYILAGSYGSPEGLRRASEVSALLSPKQVASAKQDAARFASAPNHPVLLQRK
jgi:uncharacterized protein